MELKDILQNKKVKVIPVKRDNGIFTKDHDGYFMFTDTKFSVDLPISAKTGQRKAILTKEEQELFEQELNLEKGSMSFYHKDKGYWTTFRVTLDKEGRTLDLSQPIDYLSWLVLKEQKTIAPSRKEMFNSGEYKFALVDEDEDIKTTNNKLELMKQVYKHFGKIEDSPKKMQNVLRLYGKYTDNLNPEFLKAEIQKLIDKDADEFVKIMSDVKFNTKVTIEKALKIRAVERTASKGYALKGGDLIGRTLQETVEWFENPINNDIVLKINAQIQNSEDK